MTYITIAVPEKDVLAVYELVLSRSGRPAIAAASEPGVERPAVEAVELPAIKPTSDEEVIERVWERVTDPGRAVLKALAEHAPGEYGLEQLQEVAQVPNAGAAMQSIAIQLQKEPTMPVLNTLLKMRKVDGKYRYALRADRAQIVLELAH